MAPRKKKEVAVRDDGQLIRAEERKQVDFDRAFEAHKLRMAGYPWKVVAEQVGYANDQTAIVEVRAYLQRAALEMDDQRRAEALAMELDRLDTLQAAVWPAALGGDVKAVDSALRVMSLRAKLLGFDGNQERATTVHKTLVVAGTSEQYVQALKAISEGK